MSAGWTSCIWPVLVTILVGAAQAAAAGVVLLVAYSIGLGLPFVGLAPSF